MARRRSTEFLQWTEDGSPVTPEIRTLVNIILFVRPEFAPNGRPERQGYRYAVSLVAILPRPRASTARRETPWERAARFQLMLDSGNASNRAELARMLGCSRAWVTKVLAAGRSETSVGQAPSSADDSAGRSDS